MNGKTVYSARKTEGRVGKTEVPAGVVTRV